MQIPRRSLSPARLSTQIRRALPFYIVCGLLFILFFQTEHFERYRPVPGEVFKRIIPSRASVRRETKFPKKIWQSWKIDPLEFEARDSDRARSWPKLNPGHRYEVLTDGNDLDYVETHFGPDGYDRPDIVNTYRTLNTTIIKADFLRYLVMFMEGGVYADIDVEAIRPFNTWIPTHFNESDVDFIISIEIDEPTYADHPILGQKSRSFCQWTFACKPRLPIMMRLIEHVMHWLNEVSQKQNVPLSEIELNFDEVITGTGPSAFTTAVMAEMTAQTHQRLEWDTFHNLTEPILVGNILVLTVEAFAAGQGHSNSGTHDSEKALVKHHYHASKWPSRHPRYSHPAFGMVEECNWEKYCVGNWTHNTTIWDTIPQEQQLQLIEAHEQFLEDKDEQELAEEAAREQEDAERREGDLKIQCEAIAYMPSYLSDGSQIPMQAMEAPSEEQSTDESVEQLAAQLTEQLTAGRLAQNEAATKEEAPVGTQEGQESKLQSGTWSTVKVENEIPQVQQETPSASGAGSG